MVGNFGDDTTDVSIANYHADMIIFCEGEPSAYLYLIVSGHIRVVKLADDGKVIPLVVLGPKEILGEMSMFNDSPRSATAIAMDKLELVRIKKSDVRKALDKCPEWATDVLLTISDRLRHADNILREHNIEDESRNVGPELTNQEAVKIRNLILDYKKKHGLAD